MSSLPNLPGSAGYFEQAADVYAASYSAAKPPGFALRVRQQRILEMLGPHAGKLLDGGCGPAFIAVELLKNGCDYWGMDASRRMLELASGHLPQDACAHLAIGDVQYVPYADGSFNTALCIGVIERTPDDQAVLRELLRVLKPGGTLLVSYPNLLSPYAFWKNFVYYPVVALLRPIVYRLRGRPQPPSLYDRARTSLLGRAMSSGSRLYTARAVSKRLADLGADTTGVMYALYNPCLPPMDELLPGLTRRLMGLLESFRFGPLRWLGWTILVKARKRL
jgi:SAM-dependent methyltransferase